MAGVCDDGQNEDRNEGWGALPPDNENKEFLDR